MKSEFNKVSSNNLSKVSLSRHKGFTEYVEHIQKIFRIIKNPNTLTFTVINYIRELIAQKLDDNGIHFLNARKFCGGSIAEVSASEQSRCLASVKCATLVHIRRV